MLCRYCAADVADLFNIMMKPFFIVNLLVLGHNIRHAVGLYEIYYNLRSNLVDLLFSLVFKQLVLMKN